MFACNPVVKYSDEGGVELTFFVTPTLIHNGRPCQDNVASFSASILSQNLLVFFVDTSKAKSIINVSISIHIAFYPRESPGVGQFGVKGQIFGS